jgi:hypothetical protein
MAMDIQTINMVIGIKTVPFMAAMDCPPISVASAHMPVA